MARRRNDAAARMTTAIVDPKDLSPPIASTGIIGSRSGLPTAHAEQILHHNAQALFGFAH
jgi:hypothetical protein